MNIVVPLELPEPHFFNINMAVNPLSPPQELLRLGNLALPRHDLGNMAIRPPLRPPVHFGFGDQLANMQAVHPALPPPHFFRFANSTVHVPPVLHYFMASATLFYGHR